MTKSDLRGKRPDIFIGEFANITPHPEVLQTIYPLGLAGAMAQNEGKLWQCFKILEM
jgi:hypothetical protein